MDKYMKIREALKILEINIVNAQIELDTVSASSITKRIVKDLDTSLEVLKNEIESIKIVK